MAGSRDTNPQLTAMQETLESLRREFLSCVLFLEGDTPFRILRVPRVTFESRYVMAQFNGVLVEHKPLTVHLLDMANAEAVDHTSLLSADIGGLANVDIGVAAFYSNEPLNLDSLKRMFAGANDLASLHADLLSAVVAYLGFDHDAFFTFESRDTALVEEVLKSARLPRGREVPK